jgi:hypothetical protein
MLNLTTPSVFLPKFVSNLTKSREININAVVHEKTKGGLVNGSIHRSSFIIHHYNTTHVRANY